MNNSLRYELFADLKKLNQNTNIQTGEQNTMKFIQNMNFDQNFESTITFTIRQKNINSIDKFSVNIILSF